MSHMFQTHPYGCVSQTTKDWLFKQNPRIKEFYVDYYTGGLAKNDFDILLGSYYMQKVINLIGDLEAIKKDYLNAVYRIPKSYDDIKATRKLNKLEAGLKAKLKLHYMAYDIISGNYGFETAAFLIKIYLTLTSFPVESKNEERDIYAYLDYEMHRFARFDRHAKGLDELVEELFKSYVLDSCIVEEFKDNLIEENEQFEEWVHQEMQKTAHERSLGL